MKSQKREVQLVVPLLKLANSPIRKSEKTTRVQAASLSVSRFGQFDALETTREQLRESFVLKERKERFPKVLKGNHGISTGGTGKSLTSRRQGTVDLTFLNKRPVPTNLLLDKFVR